MKGHFLDIHYLFYGVDFFLLKRDVMCGLFRTFAT